MRIIGIGLLALLVSCTSARSPRDAVLTGTIDQNLVGVAGKPTAVAADGLQKVAIVDTMGNPIGSSKDPCNANDLKPFNTFTDSTAVKVLVPPASGQQAFVCSIHVHNLSSYEERITVFEGGGANCVTSPNALDGDLNPA